MEDNTVFQEMETSARYAAIKQMVHENADTAYELTMAEVTTYYAKYVNGPGDDMDVFRVATRDIFDLMHNIFYMSYTIACRDDDMDDVPEEDRKEFEHLIDNMRFIRDHAMSTQEELSSECNKRMIQVHEYFEGMKKKQQEITDSMERMTENLGNAISLLEQEMQRRGIDPIAPMEDVQDNELRSVII